MKKLIIIFVLVIFNINIALTDNDEKIEKLKKLNDAYKSGLITKEIFESSKKRIINQLIIEISISMPLINIENL